MYKGTEKWKGGQGWREVKEPLKTDLINLAHDSPIGTAAILSYRFYSRPLFRRLFHTVCGISILGYRCGIERTFERGSDDGRVIISAQPEKQLLDHRFQRAYWKLAFQHGLRVSQGWNPRFGEVPETNHEIIGGYDGLRGRPLLGSRIGELRGPTSKNGRTQKKRTKSADDANRGRCEDALGACAVLKHTGSCGQSHWDV